MVYRDSCADDSRDGSGQKRLADDDVMELGRSVWSLADEKRADPDSIGTASDYAGTTKNYRDRDRTGWLPRYETIADNDDPVR